jgi:hypothetical protein
MVVSGDIPVTLAQARETFRHWLYLPDAGVLDFALGVLAANILPGDPVWGLLVGPPGGGKSETLTALVGIPNVHPASTLTEAALLSGTAKREVAAGAKGGLLQEVANFGIILAKDFGSVLSMHRDARASLLAALREVYDGSWTRHVGVDGGRTLHWQGKCGFLGGCTPKIDQQHAVMGAMGERFLLYRLPAIPAALQARSALEHAGHEAQMRAELATAAVDVMRNEASPRECSPEETNRLVKIAVLVARARSAVYREGYSREIDLVPPPEAPTRLVKQLDRLLGGLDVIGASREEAWATVTKTARDSVPALRMVVLDVLAREDASVDTNAIAEQVRHPATTTRRALEELTAHGLIECQRQGEGRPHLWRLSEFCRELVPYLSRNVGCGTDTLRLAA